MACKKTATKREELNSGSGCHLLLPWEIVVELPDGTGAQAESRLHHLSTAQETDTEAKHVLGCAHEATKQLRHWDVHCLLLAEKSAKK